MHSVWRNPLQAPVVRSAIGRLKLYVVMPRRDGSFHGRMPGESILVRQQLKLLIRQVGERSCGRNPSEILQYSYIRKIRRSLEIVDVEGIGLDLPPLNPIAAPLAPQPRRELLGRPVCRRGSRFSGVAGGTGDKESEAERNHHREIPPHTAEQPTQRAGP